jgi:hypothetical protein
MWMKEEMRHWKWQKEFKDVFPDESKVLPVWTGKPEIEAEARMEYLSIPPENVPDDLDGAARDVFETKKGDTIKQCYEALLKRHLRKADRDQKARTTYRWYAREFRLGFVPEAIDVEKEACTFALKPVEDFCDYWVDLVKRSAESTKGKFGWRSAWNRIDALNALLHDMEGHVPGYQYPRGAARVIAEAKQTVGGNMTAIWKYDPELLRSVVAAGDNRHRMFCYLFLNFGMYPADVGQQIHRLFEPEFGGFTMIEGERYLQWWRHKLLRRRRQMVRDSKGKEIPVLLTHYVWPELWDLLERFAAEEDNPHNKWLLNDHGLPLWRHPPHAKNRIDNISTAYYRVLREANHHRPIPRSWMRACVGTR